jgi:hypothetical protein
MVDYTLVAIFLVLVAVELERKVVTLQGLRLETVEMVLLRLLREHQ